jgi:hypothetical protein
MPSRILNLCTGLFSGFKSLSFYRIRKKRDINELLLGVHVVMKSINFCLWISCLDSRLFQPVASS